MKIFDKSELKRLYIQKINSQGEDNGQVAIIGGSDLFHGAPIYALKIASRVVDMVFFSSTEPSVGYVAEALKSKLMSFIWIPWNELDKYAEKSDAILIGPGMKRFKKEVGNEKLEISNTNLDSDGKETREITERLLKKFPHKKWVIDAGSLQTMDREWIPERSILTPNKKEFSLLFDSDPNIENACEMAKKYKCIIVLKGPETYVCGETDCLSIDGGNAGLTKGGTGDCLAGLTVALLAKNDPYLAACSASYIAKAAADELYNKVGILYNADDLADQIPVTFAKLLK